MRTSYRILIAIFGIVVASNSVAAEAWEKGACRKKDMDYPVVDFHAHTFNFRHLPLRGILYGWGVPDFVAGVAADIIWGMTGRVEESAADQFASLQYRTGSDAISVDFRTRAISANIDYLDAPIESLSTPERDRFDRELNEYLVSELENEQAMRTNASALGQPADTPLTDYFADLSGQPGASSFNIGALAPDGHAAMVNAMAELKIVDRLVALLIKPFELVATVQGAYRFFAVMIQPEDKLAQQLLDENCMVDYFVHYMMDLEPVYNSAPPVAFADQHAIVKKMRELNDDRLITFSAFVPFRYDDYDLSILKTAIASGVVGAKYYPPSGYSASVDRIPRKPKRFRGIIYQGGARKQWKHRYNPLGSNRVRRNWGVTVTNPSKAKEQTLEGVSQRFFEFAENEGLLIFAHHTPQGFEGYKGYGQEFADPCKWLPRLKENPKLRLILGHSGGDAWYGTDADFDRSFGVQAHNLCVTYENVYCDFGYHENVLTDDGKNALRTRLQAMHDRSTTTSAAELFPQSCRTTHAPMEYSIFDKIMYGSDWMMVIKERNYEKMVSAFEAVFTGDLSQYKERFFGGNALAILRKSGKADQLPEPLQAGD